MAEISFINPLSNEGRSIIREYGDLNQIFDEDEHLIEEVTHTLNQKISDDSLIPKSYYNLAIKRMQWAIEKKNNKNFSQSEFEYLFNENIFKQDVVVFHILCQAIAIRFNTGSRETRLFIESQGNLIVERLAKIQPISRAEIIDEVLDEIKTDGAIKWKSLKEVISTKSYHLLNCSLAKETLFFRKMTSCTNSPTNSMTEVRTECITYWLEIQSKNLYCQGSLCKKQRNTFKELKKCPRELKFILPS